MTIKEIIQKLNITMTDASGQESHFESWLTLNDGIIDAVDALKALDKREPVAWMNDSTPSGIFARHIDGARNFGCTIPLYTNPPQRKPLTRERLVEMADAQCGLERTFEDWVELFAREIEAAHGIKE